MSEKEMQELYRMQEDAKKRVMDMRSRSRFAAEQMDRSLRAPQPVQTGDAPPPEAAPQPAQMQQVWAAAPGAPDGEELEKLFILSLCMLLAHEEADRSVILGLLYLLT